MIIPTLTQLPSLEDTTVIVRAGLNVPLGEDGDILDDFRLTRFLPTLHYLIEGGAKIIIVAHLGREKEDTLESVAHYLSKHVPLEFKSHFFNNNVLKNIEELQEEVTTSKPGSVFLLDNVRQSECEKENNEEIARALGSWVNLYVNEAFSVSHREHMSLSALPKVVDTCVTGIACNEEIEQLGIALNPPKRSIAVISGNKFDTKLPLIQKFLKHYETVVVGGALANTLYSLAGYDVGKSLYEEDLNEQQTKDLTKVLENKRLYLPNIVVTGTGDGEKQIKSLDEINEHDYIYDCAPEGLVEIELPIEQSDLLVWNGPLGYYEGGYIEGTQRLLELAVRSSAQSIIGGGNTVDAARDLGYEEKVSHLSTGGGAMIKYLTDGTLPALEALVKKK